MLYRAFFKSQKCLSPSKAKKGPKPSASYILHQPSNKKTVLLDGLDQFPPRKVIITVILTKVYKAEV